MRKLLDRPMRLSVLVALTTGALVTAVAAPAAAAPRPDGPTLAPLKPGGPKVAADRYIVVLSPAASGVSRAARAARTADAAATAERAGGTVLTRYARVLDGYAAKLSPAALAAVRADPAVAYVEPDSVITGGTDQPNPPSWGLDRVDQRTLPLNNNFSYTSTGTGVTAYIVDSGIRASHVDFGTRASGVFDAVGDGNGTNDCHGHGTHVAGTAGGATYGVAKAVTIKAVRVLQCDNTGFTSDLIEGMDWLAANHDPVSVANFSLQGYGTAPSQATENLIDAGVQTVFIANNFNTDACTNGPRSPRGITVGATTITDTRASFSSYGTCVDVFAPGVGITSAGITSDTAVASGWSGTSMAAPHVTGWVARYLQQNPGATMAQSKAALIEASTKNVVIDPGPGSPNRLLHAAPTDLPPDTQAPTAPGQPTASSVTSTSVQLSWTASTDNVGVVGYDVYRDTTLVAQPTGTSATVSGLTPATQYTFSVRARDAAGNVSAPSPGTPVTTQAGAAPACRVTYQITSSWNTGFNAVVTIANIGTAAYNGWTLAFDFTAGQQIVPSSGYNATWSQTGTRVTAVNLSWNQTIAPGSSVSAGFQGTHTGSTPVPPSFTVNGATCT